MNTGLADSSLQPLAAATQVPSIFDGMALTVITGELAFTLKVSLNCQSLSSSGEQAAVEKLLI